MYNYINTHLYCIPFESCALQERQDFNREASINPWGIEGDEAMDALVDALWADPGDMHGSQPNPRGAGHVWGPDYTRRFLESTNLKLVIRSHQVPIDQTLVLSFSLSVMVPVASFPIFIESDKEEYAEVCRVRGFSSR